MNYQARALWEYFMAYLAVATAEQALEFVYVGIGAFNRDPKFCVGILRQCFETSVAFPVRNRRFRRF